MLGSTLSRFEAHFRGRNGEGSMPPVPVVVLEFDDNSPLEMPAFSFEASVWNMQYDYNLHTRTATEVFRTIHEALDGSNFRGYPKQVARSTFELFNGLVEHDEVTWLSGEELAASDS